jgi:GNAT superfamily N-acetyltransferase
MTTVEAIAAGAAPGYAPFVPSRFKALLTAGALEPELKLVGASIFGEPRGAALVRLSPKSSVASVESVTVAAPLRQQGIGRAMVAELEREVASAGATQIRALFAAKRDEGLAPARLARSLGWSLPVARFQQFEFDSGLARAPLFALDQPLGGFELKSFTALSNPERRELDWLGTEQAPSLHPFAEQYALLPNASFVLRLDGRIIGWLAAHELAPRAVRWSALWTTPSVRGRSPVGALFAASFERTREAGAERWCGIVEHGNAAMMRIAERRFLPYALGAFTLYETSRLLTAASPSSSRSRSLSSFHQPTDARSIPVPGSSRMITPRS